MIALADYPLQEVLAVYHASREGGRSYVETHKASRGRDGEVRLGAGKPLSLRALKALAVQLGKEVVAENQGLLPERVLALRPDGGIIWWLPAARRGLARKERPTLEAWWPPLVLVLAEGGLSVFALREDGRPGPGSRLFRAPFWNVYQDGGVCMGSGKLPGRGSAEERVAAAEEAFIGTPFTHEVGSGGAVRSKDLNAVWARIAGTRRRFPRSELVPHAKKKTLADLARERGF